MTATNAIAKVTPYITEAELVAWDGCHKIYLALDDAEAEWFRDNYEIVVEGTAEAMLAAVDRWWDESCGLRFIQGVRHNPTNPNAGFVSIVPQFAEDDDEDDDEDTFGECDECGAEYDAASRFDHDADAGLCWDCAGRDLDTMTTTELDAYLAG